MAVRTSVAGLAAVAVLGACSRDSGEKGGGATVPTTARTTTTVDPYAVPEIIDVAYVNRVLGALDAAVGDVTRMVLAEQSVSPEVTKRLQAIYQGEVLDLNIKSLQSDIQAGLKDYKSQPGNQVSTVVNAISLKPGCVFAEIHRDYSAVSTESDPRLGRLWIALTRQDPRNRVYNPTPWIFSYDGLQRDYSPPANPCADS